MNVAQPADLERTISKYDSLKYWAKIKARVLHRCQRCEAIVNEGEFYYKQKINFVNPPPGFALGELCERCGEDTIRQ